jgi:hypothetical protein
MAHSNGGKFPFLNQLPIFHHWKIQFKFPYNVTKLDFKNRWIWHVNWAVRCLRLPPSLGTVLWRLRVKSMIPMHTTVHRLGWRSTPHLYCGTNPQKQ